MAWIKSWKYCNDTKMRGSGRRREQMRQTKSSTAARGSSTSTITIISTLSGNGLNDCHKTRLKSFNKGKLFYAILLLAYEDIASIVVWKLRSDSGISYESSWARNSWWKYYEFQFKFLSPIRTKGNQDSFNYRSRASKLILIHKITCLLLRITVVIF